MEMTPQRWANTCAYLREVFGQQDDQLNSLMPRAIAAGLPSIAVSADVGRLLQLLTLMVCGAGRRAVAVELGTLAGYSSIWIARGLPAAPHGKLITVELEEKHAAFAQHEFERADVADRIELRRGAALTELPRIAREVGTPPTGGIDLAFLDAVKTEYPEYFRLLRPLIRPGGLLVADNALGSSFWIDDPPGSSPERDAVDEFNRTVAADPDFVTACVPIREGVLIARRMG